MENRGTYNFDLNGDGITDFFTMSPHRVPLFSAVETPARGSSEHACRAGTQNGPNEEFVEATQTMASCNYFCRAPGIYGGHRPKGLTRYLGFSFLVDRQTHYEWAAVEFNVILSL